MSSLVIQHATVISPSDGYNGKADIQITDGKITAVGENLSGDAVIDATGLVAVPGLVDMHVHLRDPGQTAKEDILSGCRAAAAGGVTSLLAMPNTVPAVDTPETVRYILDKAKDAAARVYVAAAITKGLRSEEPTDLTALRQAGAVGLSDDGRPVVNSRFLRDAMRQAPQRGMTVVAHCEDLYLADGGKINEGAVSEALGVKGIPAAAEDCGTAREIALAAAENVPVHICHVSTKTSVALIRDAKRRGVAVTAETAPHYFSLTEQELLRRDADFRMNPPLRTAEDVKAIIEGLRDGTLDAIATDHAPHTPQEKADFEKAPNGSIGMETSLAVGITFLVKTGLLTLPQLIEKMSVNPARILGIPAGTLAVGANADIALLNPDEQWTVNPDALHGKSKNTPFKGMTLTGRVKMTLLGGKLVFNA
ncbi:MAG: dihydroorotase [Ruminococcus sp.]|nr:dihydroorotase [Ruminococcus sp.]